METFAFVALATTFQLIIIEPWVKWRLIKVFVTLVASALTLHLLDGSLGLAMLAVQAQACSLIAGLVLLRLGKSSDAPVARLRSRIPPM